MKRAWQDGKLEAEDWAEQRRELVQERQAADAEAARLHEQERHTAEGASLVDIEAATLRHLADLRGAVVGEVRGADGVAAARAVLLKVFEHFTLHPGTVADLEPDDGPGPADADPTVDAVAAGEYVILTHPRAAAVVGIDEDWRPVLRREPLPLPADSDGEGFDNAIRVVRGPVRPDSDWGDRLTGRSACG